MKYFHLIIISRTYILIHIILDPPLNPHLNILMGASNVSGRLTAISPGEYMLLQVWIPIRVTQARMTKAETLDQEPSTSFRN